MTGVQTCALPIFRVEDRPRDLRVAEPLLGRPAGDHLHPGDRAQHLPDDSGRHDPGEGGDRLADVQAAPEVLDDRTLLMLEVEHRPGGLADAINVFKKQRLNMTWIESFPIAGSDGRYMFFIEFDGHATDAKARRAIELLERRCLRLEVLGCCPRGLPLG